MNVNEWKYPRKVVVIIDFAAILNGPALTLAAAVEKDVEPPRVTVHVAHDNRPVPQNPADKLQKTLNTVKKTVVSTTIM